MRGQIYSKPKNTYIFKSIKKKKKLKTKGGHGPPPSIRRSILDCKCQIKGTIELIK